MAKAGVVSLLALSTTELGGTLCHLVLGETVETQVVSLHYCEPLLGISYTITYTSLVATLAENTYLFLPFVVTITIVLAVTIVLAITIVLTLVCSCVEGAGSW